MGLMQDGEIFIDDPILNPELISSAILHELTHLIVRLIAGDIKSLPWWFDEGLARYVGGEKDFILITWGNVLSCVPPEKLNLYQTEEAVKDFSWELSAYSAVEFLYENWGKEKANRLIVVFGENNDFESAFKEIIGMSTSKFERLWKKKNKRKILVLKNEI